MHVHAAQAQGARHYMYKWYIVMIEVYIVIINWLKINIHGWSRLVQYACAVTRNCVNNWKRQWCICYIQWNLSHFDRVN